MSKSVPKTRRAGIRIVMVLAAAFTAWHVFASFLWIAPYSQAARSVIPGDLLTDYMIPFFGQSWSVFAPEPINGNYTLKVRARWTTDGVETTTAWVDATKVELSMIQYNLFPPRAGVQSSEVASSYKAAWDALSADHKVIVGLSYFKGDDWAARLEDKLDSYGVEGGAGDGVDVVEPYVAAEHLTLAYATQVARAIWGDDVETVQFEVYRQNVIPFASRNDPDAQPLPLQTADTGWRGPVVEDGQSEADFSDVFRAAYERLEK